MADLTPKSMGDFSQSDPDPLLCPTCDAVVPESKVEELRKLWEDVVHGRRPAEDWIDRKPIESVIHKGYFSDKEAKWSEERHG